MARKTQLLNKALLYAWTDFANDVRHSLGGDKPSMAMEWRIEWIKELSEVVGPISWRDVEIPLLASGWFQRVHKQLGYPVETKEINEAIEKWGKR